MAIPTRANKYAALFRPIHRYWFGHPAADIAAIPQPPDLLNNESLLAINAAGTGLVSLIKASASDVATIPGPLSVLGDLVASGIFGGSGINLTATARTATADGTGTGTIATGSGAITVTSADANNIIVLPAPTPFTIVILHVAATGYELRTNAPATVAINGGTGSAAESAIGANTTVVMICATATSWKGWQLGSDGTLAKVEVAAP